MRSAHTVAHRGSLAYRMFILAAESRDRWLRNQNHGDFSATVQKYYTGMSLSRYILLICVEFPLIFLTSLTTWLMFLGVPGYIFERVLHVREQIGIGNTVFFIFLIMAAFILSIAASLLIGAGLMAWAGSGPSAPTRFFRRYLFKLPPYYRDQEIEKFPGPITLIKKWILSAFSGVPSQITWDTGKRDSRS